MASVIRIFRAAQAPTSSDVAVIDRRVEVQRIVSAHAATWSGITLSTASRRAMAESHPDDIIQDQLGLADPEFGGGSPGQESKVTKLPE